MRTRYADYIISGGIRNSDADLEFADSDSDCTFGKLSGMTSSDVVIICHAVRSVYLKYIPEFICQNSAHIYSFWI